MEAGQTGDSEPRVSVVIPTYKRPDLVVGAIRSVDEQTVDDVEVVVVDDHSPTPVEPVLDSELQTEVTVRCFRHDENEGANAARNTGIRAACGEFVAFLDDDDLWEPTFLARQLEAFDSTTDDVGVVYTGIKVVDDNGDIVGVFETSVSGDVTAQLLCGARIGSFSRMMVRKSVIERAGLPDESYPSWQDKEWQLRLSRHCRFGCIDEALVTRRFDHDQISDNYRKKRDITYPMLIEEYRPLAARYGFLVERQFMAATTTALALSALQSETYADAARFALQSLAANPLQWTTWAVLLLALGGDRLYKPVREIKRQFPTRIPNI